MVLDNEEQRKALLAIIEAVPLQGVISQIRETVKLLEKLKGEVTTASVAA
jgi:hypothetical protein